MRIDLKFQRLSFLVITITLFLFTRSSNIIAQTSERQVYEAEAGMNNGLLLLDDSTASAGKFLRMKDFGNVTWNISADTSTCMNSHSGIELLVMIKKSI
jgi:hypothetical protein